MRIARKLAVLLCAIFGAGIANPAANAQMRGSPVAFTESDAAIPSAALPNTPDPNDREVSIKRLPINILNDQKDIVLFPVSVAKGHHLFPTIALIGVTGGLIAGDLHDTGYFRRTDSFHGFNNAMTSGGTAAAIAIVPAGLYAIGLIRHDNYATNTALFAGEAVADGFIVSLAIKAVTRRVSPSDISPQGPFNDTFFNSHRSVLKSGGFPSVHAMAALSVATVISRRYRTHKWVPYVAYGAAGVICFSRVTRSAHFPSDVVLGAALGYTIARFDVLRDR